MISDTLHADNIVFAGQISPPQALDFDGSSHRSVCPCQWIKSDERSAPPDALVQEYQADYLAKLFSYQVIDRGGNDIPVDHKYRLEKEQI